MRTLRGNPASGGTAIGPAVVVEPAALPVGGRIAPGEEAAEGERFSTAAGAVAAEYTALARSVRDAGHPDEGNILEAQAAMALDSTLRHEVEARIREGVDAVAAVLEASRALAGTLRALGDEVLAARAVDLEDVGARIARRLAGLREDSGPRLSGPSIIVARDLAAATTATLPRDRLAGLALEASSPTAHAAIMARAWGIPAVVGVAGLLDALSAGGLRQPGSVGGSPVDLAIDGTSGEVVIAPDRRVRDRVARRQGEARAAAALDRAEATTAAITTDGAEVVLLANLGAPEEAATARELGARGVGLFRTEFLFLERRTAPGEDEQVAAYRAVVAAFAPDPVTIRLLDVGGDKAIPYIPLPPEDNPFLGVRALRLAATAPELFVTQLRAAMRAATIGSVKVMAPMVADLTDVAVLRDLAARAATSLTAEGIEHGPIQLGAMLEIPSSVILADRLLAELDFASLGTNDLLQYTLAADRGNAALAPYHDPLHPALLALVQASARAATAAGVELSVCGEMAGDPEAARVLVGLGIRRLSMSASSFGPVRRAIRGSSVAGLEALAARALAAGSATDVRQVLGQDR